MSAMSSLGPRLRVLCAPLLTILVAVGVVATSSSTLGAQDPGSVELVAQTSWIDDGGIFNLQVRVAGASSDSTVVVRVYEPWIDRADFLARDLENNAGVLLELAPVLLGEAQQTSNEVLGFEVLIDGPLTRTEVPEEVPVEVTAEGELPADPIDVEPPLPTLITNGGSAVYPIEVSLLNPNGEPIDSFLSSIIELPRRDLRPPLDVSIIFEPEAEAILLADQTSELTPEVLTDLSVLSSMLNQHTGANASLSISPETLSALQADGGELASEIIEQFQNSLSSEQLLPRPISSVEEQAWIEAGLVDDLVELYDAGSNATNDVLTIVPQRSVSLLDPTVEGDSLDELLELGVQGLIVRPPQISPLDREVFPQSLTTRFLVNIDKQNLGDDEPDALPALAADIGLGNHFIDSDASVLNANRLLADLVLLSLQESGGRSSVVVAPPASWKPDPNFLNVLLGGIERIPALEGATPIDALANTEITPSLGIGTLSGPLRRDLVPTSRATSLGSFRTEYSQARNAISSWATVIGNDNTARVELDQLLYRSTDQRLGEAERNSFIEAVFSDIDEQKDSAITTPESETITLTGRESDVPVLLENTLDTNATVLMLLSSEELDFTESAELVRTLEPGTNRIEIPITARASGDSPIQIQVLSPDGLILLGSSEVLVRTFAFSGLGLAIGAVAIIVLLVWWVRHVRGTRDNVDTLSEVIGV